jgi:hypothetical protein
MSNGIHDPRIVFTQNLLVPVRSPLTFPPLWLIRLAQDATEEEILAAVGDVNTAAATETAANLVQTQVATAAQAEVNAQATCPPISTVTITATPTATATRELAVTPTATRGAAAPNGVATGGADFGSCPPPQIEVRLRIVVISSPESLHSLAWASTVARRRLAVRFAVTHAEP